MSVNRYEFYAYNSNLMSQLSSYLSGDLYWDVKYQGTTYGNYGSVSFDHKTNNNMFFYLAMQNWSYCYNIRAGIWDNGTTIKPDLYTDLGIYTEIPTQMYSGSNYNIYYKFTVFTSDSYVFVYGDPQNYHDRATGIKLYMGKIKPFETEDPAVANNFIGIFPHMPMNISTGYTSNENWAFGQGYVQKSRNASKNQLYKFSTNSQVVSPGAGDKYYISPFYVYQSEEGTRGEFDGVRTCVLKNGSKHPDGSVLDVGTDRYLVFHVPNTRLSYISYDYWYTTGGHARWSRPYFFDTTMVPAGQRVLLFKI